MKKHPVHRLLAVVTGVAVSVSGCFSDRPATAAPAADVADLQIAGFAFDPPSVSVAAGTTLTWTNEDAAIHTVSADNGAFDSDGFDQGKTFRLESLAPGTYPYFCRIHPFMRGTVTVTP